MADTALDERLRQRVFPNSRLSGPANLLIGPNLDASNIAFNVAKIVSEGVAVGPILLGMAQSAHVVTPLITARGLLNMTAIAAVLAQDLSAERV